jgi:hypothetical protein
MSVCDKFPFVRVSLSLFFLSVMLLVTLAAGGVSPSSRRIIWELHCKAAERSLEREDTPTHR